MKAGKSQQNRSKRDHPYDTNTNNINNNLNNNINNTDHQILISQSQYLEVETTKTDLVDPLASECGFYGSQNETGAGLLPIVNHGYFVECSPAFATSNDIYQTGFGYCAEVNIC